MIIRTPTWAMMPGIFPISVRIMSPKDLPSRRVDMNRTIMSCTAPASTAPTRIHKTPGR